MASRLAHMTSSRLHLAGCSSCWQGTRRAPSASHRCLRLPATSETAAAPAAKLYTYPEINQFRHVIKYLTLDGNAPILDYYGTVKLHGAHTDILQRSDSTLLFQSRNRQLTTDDEVFGFAKFASALNLMPLFKKIRGRAGATPSDDVVLCGEWCGCGIQRGVAIPTLSKRFVIFDINVGGRWQCMQDFADIHDEAQLVFNVMEFPVYNMTIDFGAPEDVQEKLAALTQAVEDECPAGAYFGVQGTGEGIVWKPVDANRVRNSQIWFKVKGPKHSVVRVKKTRDAAAVAPAKMKGIKEFVERCITDNRCEQGLAVVVDAAASAGGQEAEGQLPIGAFLKWVVTDVVKEEGDVIEANGWKTNDVNRALSTAAREWILEQKKAVS